MTDAFFRAAKAGFMVATVAGIGAGLGVMFLWGMTK